MNVLSSIARFFPPPRFMTLPSMGVDISDASLKYVQFERDGQGLRLAHYGALDIPEGAVSQGMITDREKLTDTLRAVKKRCDGVEYVRVSLPEERAYLFETTIERDAAYDDIRGALEFKLEENVPLSPRDAFFDYDIVEDNEKEEQLKVGVAVYARETILQYYEACINAKLVPISFEIEAQAIARATMSMNDNGTTMILDFGKNRTGIGIVQNRSLLYTSTIDIGGQQLSSALRSQLGDCKEAELTKIKNEHGLLKENDSDNVYEAILPTMSALRDEIATQISYWNTHRELQDGQPIEKIILCGGSSNLAGLPEYFTKELGIPSERADIWQNAFSYEKTIPPITKAYSYGYTTAVGLALRPFTTDHL